MECDLLQLRIESKTVIIWNKETLQQDTPLDVSCCFLVRPVGAHSNGCKSLIRPVVSCGEHNGKDIAEGKGVHREMESEESRMSGTY